MSTGKEFARGSEWRIWDLHVHTPCSVLNNGFGDDWDKYVQNLFRKAIANNIRAIGVTDYFTIEGYKKLKQEYLQNDTRLKSLFIENEISYINSMLILPNIEFRLNKFVGEKRINFHIIFSDEVPFRDIEENFLRRLEFSMSASPIVCTDKRCLTIENLAELGEKLKSQHEPFRNDSSLKVGMKCATVDDEEISKILTQTHGIFEGKYLICIPSDEDLSSVSWNGQDHLARKLLIQKSHAHFTANPKSIEWALGKMHPSQRDFSNEFGSLRPCFWGSDAHNYDEIFTKNAERKLWIKADLTFEGLKQTTYEPEERVKIQAENPANAFDKLTLRQIEICNSVKVFDAESLEFQKQCIPLNQNLIAIIGGRGTGKSVLVDYIAHGFKQSPNRMNDSIFSQSENFSVTIKRSLAEKDDFVFLFDKQHDVDILFISQNEVKEKTKNHKDLGAEVNRMLGLEKITHTHDMLNEKIKHIRNEYASILEWFEIKDDSDNKINCIEFIEKEACRFKNLLNMATHKDKKESIENYTALIEEKRKNEILLSKLSDLEKELKDSSAKLNASIKICNVSITPVDFSHQLQELEAEVTRITLYCATVDGKLSKIKEQFTGYTGDLATLLNDVEKFRTALTLFEERQKEHAKKTAELSALKTLRTNFANDIKLDLQAQKEAIDTAWDVLSSGKPDWTHEQRHLMKGILEGRKICISGEIIFNKNEFYSGLKKLCDGRKYSGESGLIDYFQINSYDTFMSFMAQFDTNNDLIRSVALAQNVTAIEDYLFDLDKRKKYLYVLPMITYDKKTLDKISVGQRGTIYLCLKLATNAFSKPIIFDQPEDDLDNDFIFNDLTSIFKQVKKYRQVILVTHNANVVVNADAEQVIVASNDHEKLSYFSGSLEHQRINEAVCNILEGGRQAFRQRENKYRLHWEN